MSLMSLMIWDVLSAEARIFPMAPCICSTAAAPSVAAERAVEARVLACWALSAACLVIDMTDSREEEVSSRELACSLAPEATACDDEAICVEALETCSTAEATWASASWSASPVALSESLILA